MVWHATLPKQKQITYAHAFIALLFLVLIDVGDYVRSPMPGAQDLTELLDSHMMLSKHVNSACKSSSFSVSNIGGIGKYLDRDKCFLLYVKLKLSFMGTDHSLPVPLDFGMHYEQTLRILNHSVFLRVKLELRLLFHQCYRVQRYHIIVEYRDYYYHYYYYVQGINNISISVQYSFSCFPSEIYSTFRVFYTACNLKLGL